MLWLLAALQTADRLPEPAKKDLQAVEQSVRAAFKDDYAKKSPELAPRLLSTALETKDPTSRYFLLRESRDLAAEAGLAGVAARAVDVLLKEYELDRRIVLAALCGALNKTAKTPGSLKAYALACQRWSEGFVAADNLEASAQMLGHADAAARKARDLDLVAALQDRAKEIAELKRLSTKAKAAEKKPDDPAARADMGRYLCFAKGDWAAGLPLLDQAPEAELKALAAKDLAAPAAAEARQEIGEAWLSWADKQGPLKALARERGLHWLRLAWPELTGLPKEKLRAKFRSLAERPEGKGREMPGPARGWIVAEMGAEKPEGVAMDEGLARAGRRSARVAARPKGILASERAAIQPGRKLKVSFWILTERADKVQAGVLFVSATDASTGIVHLPAAGDQPWWTRVEADVEIPPNTAFFRFSFTQKFPQGTAWIDEVSVKDADGDAELVENGSFEEK